MTQLKIYADDEDADIRWIDWGDKEIGCIDSETAMIFAYNFEDVHLAHIPEIYAALMTTPGVKRVVMPRVRSDIPTREVPLRLAEQVADLTNLAKELGIATARMGCQDKGAPPTQEQKAVIADLAKEINDKTHAIYLADLDRTIARICALHEKYFKNEVRPDPARMLMDLVAEAIREDWSNWHDLEFNELQDILTRYEGAGLKI